MLRADWTHPASLLRLNRLRPSRPMVTLPGRGIEGCLPCLALGLRPTAELVRVAAVA
ncbi:MAG: hypothetical protein AAGI50_03945 [Pseudomonadota bacterium]